MRVRRGRSLVWPVIFIASIMVVVGMALMFPEQAASPYGVVTMIVGAASGVISLAASILQILAWEREPEQEEEKPPTEKAPTGQESQASEKPKPFMVEPLPENFVPRPAEYEAVVEALLDQPEAGQIEALPRAVGITAALRGAGGYGKSTLARAACHDARVRAAFPDGVLWATLGENPSEQEQIAKIGYLVSRLTGEKEQFPDLATAAARFHEILNELHVLLVVDDVWNRAHLNPFLQGGPGCGCLITTRNDDTLPKETRKVNVDAMREPEGLRLIASGLPAGKRKELFLLSRRLGNWALLLSLANGYLRSLMEMHYTLEQAIRTANEDYDRHGLAAFNEQDPVERNQAADRTLAVSLEHLGKVERRLFLELAVFPEDRDISLGALEALWGFTRQFTTEEVEKLCRVLFQRSLVQRFEPEGRTIRLHDVVRRFLVEQQQGRLANLHESLLEGYKKKCPEGWHTGPNDGYFFGRLAHHLAGAGQAEELEKLLLNFEWIDAHLRNGGIGELLEDYEIGLAAVNDSPREIRLMQGALQLSAHVLARDADQLAEQLFGRLLPMKSARIQELLNQAKQRKGHAWLRPVFPCFNAPGSGELRTLEGHEFDVDAIAISPDGRMVVSGSRDNTLKVWELDTGKEICTLKGHTHSIRAVAISPDGRLVVSGSFDKTLKVWDLKPTMPAKGVEELQTMKGHYSEGSIVAFQPGEKLVASGSGDETLRFWDLTDGKLLGTWRAPVEPEHILGIGPDVQLVITSTGKGGKTLKVWNLGSGEALLLKGHTKSVQTVAISPDSRLAVSGSWDNTLKVWDLESGEELRTLSGHSNVVHTVAISPDGRLAVSGSYDSTLKVWDLDSGRELRTLSGHSGGVHAVAISPDGRLAVSGSGDKTLKVWDLGLATLAETGETLPMRKHTGSVNAVAISPDGRLAISGEGIDEHTGTGQGTLKVWDLDSGEELHELSGHSDSVNAAAISPDGRLAVSGSSDKTIKVWDLDSGEELHTLVGHTTFINTVAISPDGRLVISGARSRSFMGTDQGMLKVWDLLSGEELTTLGEYIGSVDAMAIGPDGRLVVSGHGNSDPQLWDLTSWRKLGTLKGGVAGIKALAISPDGRLVISGAGSRLGKLSFLLRSALQVWELDSEEKPRELKGHIEGVFAVAVSPDSQLAVSGSSDKTLRVWDISKGTCLASFYCNGEVNCCAITPDGQMIIAGDESGTVYFLKIEGINQALDR